MQVVVTHTVFFGMKMQNTSSNAAILQYSTTV